MNNYCPDCKVKIEYGLKCPLCFKNIKGKSNGKIYPKYKIKKKNKTVHNIFLFASIAITLLSFLANGYYFTYYKYPWSLFVFLTIIYLWVLVKHTILSRVKGGNKVLMQVFCLSIICVIVDVNTGFHRWSVNYVIPYILLVSTAVIAFIARLIKMLWSEYINFVIASIFLCFIPLILSLLNVATVYLPGILAGTCSVLTFIGLMIFANKRFKNEVIGRFHI